MFLTPNKYTNINKSVLGVSSSILNILLKEGASTYNNLLGRISYKEGEGIRESFLMSLCFLHSLGKVTYYPKEDIIELIRTANNETK